MILIVSSLADSHATSVKEKLDAKGIPCYLFDTSLYPKSVQLPFEYDLKIKEMSLWDIPMNENIDLQKIKVAWWRRPLPIEIHDDITDYDAMQFTYNDCLAALSGVACF